MSYPVFTVFAGDVVPIFFGSYAGATGASAAMTGLAVTDIEIYKDGSVTQRASDAGYTLLDTDGLDFDGITGINGFSIDTGDNTDAGFYTVGAWFTVVVSAVTVDSQTVSFIAAQFRIVAAETIAGVPKVDEHAISGDTTAADNLETMLDGTGGQNLTLARLVADNSAGSGPGIYAKGGDSEAGMELVGTGSGAGLRASGGATGNGVIVNGGGSSYGMAINSASGGLAALALIGTGAEPGLSILAGPTGHGVLVTGGSTSGDGIRAEVTSGAPFRGDLTGNVTGNLSGSVGSVTGAVGSVAAGGITASSIATDAIDADALAANAVAEIQSGLATAAALDAVDNFIDTEVGAIKTVTDKLDTAVELDGAVYRFTTNALEQAPSGGGGVADWTADQRTAIAAILGIPASGTTPDDPTTGILDTIRDAVGVVDDLVDTEVAAIKAKTDLISGATLVAADLASLATAANLATVDTVVDAIKLKTDLIAGATLVAGDLSALATAAAVAGVLTEVQKVPRLGTTYRHTNPDTLATADVTIEAAS